MRLTSQWLGSLTATGEPVARQSHVKSGPVFCSYAKEKSLLLSSTMNDIFALSSNSDIFFVNRYALPQCFSNWLPDKS